MIELITPPPVGLKTARVWQRNADVWLSFYKASLVGILGEPLLYLLALGVGLGRFITEIEGVSYVEFIAPGLVISAAMYAAAFECTFGSFTRMSVQKTYDAIVVTPINIEEVAAGDILWGATKSTLSGLAMLLILTIFGVIHSPWALTLPLLVALVGLAFASLSMFASTLAYSYEFFSYFFTLVIAPMFLFSGIFFPLSGLPVWVHYISWIFPTTHAVNISRALTLGRLTFPLISDLVWLVIFSLIFFTLAVNNTRRRLIK